MTKAIKNAIETIRANRDEDGTAEIDNKTTAKFVRAALKRHFPSIKFAVRSDAHSVNVSWTNGPTDTQVDQVIGQFSFGGFDGMIDLAYRCTNWLHPDGSMSPAASSGTEGSRGTVEAFTTDCPEPGAFLVKYGPKYVHGQRHTTEEHMSSLAAEYAETHSFDYDPSKPTHEQYCSTRREWLSTLLHRYEQEIAC